MEDVLVIILLVVMMTAGMILFFGGLAFLGINAFRSTRPSACPLGNKKCSRYWTGC